MNWGTEKQSYYVAGREIQTVQRSQIEAHCKCGYLTLNPSGDFESHNGGLTVRRSTVRIINDATGRIIKRLRGVRKYTGCNACVNDWK